MGGGGPGAGPGSAARWVAVRAAALLAVVTVLAAATGTVLQRDDGGPAASWARSTGADALWIGSGWLAGAQAGRPAGRPGAGPSQTGPIQTGPSQTALGQLTRRIRESGIRDVYVAVGRLDDAGRLPGTGYAGAGAGGSAGGSPGAGGSAGASGRLRRLRAAVPGIRVSAWISGVAGRLNLGDPGTRGRVVASAAHLLAAGFSGIDYDIQAVTSGDSGLLALLDATRALHPRPLTVSVPKLEPLPGLRLPAQLVAGRPVFWTTGYLAAVASRAGQVAVAGYDTGMPFQSWYGGYVARETGLALRAVPRQVQVVVGLPAFGGSDLGHHAAAETVAAAVQGVRVAATGAGRAAVPPGRLGVALVSAGTATAQDWASYLNGWVRPG
jgi:hypothetical protein